MKRLYIVLLGLILLLSGCSPASHSTGSASEVSCTLSLTQPPRLTLVWDGGEGEVATGSFHWIYATTTGQTATIGDGVDPTQTTQVLTIDAPQVDCAIDCPVLPDYIVVNQWHSEDLCVCVYTGPVEGSIPLAAGYIYEIDASWQEEQYASRSFWGNAEYAFRVE